MQQDILTHALGLICTECNCPIVSCFNQGFLAYLQGGISLCSHCGKPLDIFDIVRGCIEENFFCNDVFAFTKAKKSVFTILLSCKESTLLTFEEYGIPKGSRILHVNYTSQGEGLFPLECHGNSPYRGTPRDAVVLYPANFGEGSASSVNVNVMVTWIESGSLEDTSLKSLVDAFEEYSRGEFLTTIVPAHTAIEFDVMRYAKAALEKVSSKNNVKEFFRSGVSYVPTLKVLMPLLAKLNGFPEMPEDLLNSLVQLASLRNKIAHTGRTDISLTKKVTAACLTGTVLGKWYMSELSRTLS